MSDAIGFLFKNSENRAQDEILMRPFVHILPKPSHWFMRRLAYAFNHWLDVDANTTERIIDAMQILHTSSLLIDDIQDSSVMRKGVPSAHILYNTSMVLNTAIFSQFIAMEQLLKLSPETVEIFAEQLVILHRGQGLEIFWRDHLEVPTEQEYKDMTIQKTGGLFLLAVRVLQLFSGNKADFGPLVSLLGYYHQIRDDYCNLRLQESFVDKTYCEDLTEGKFSFPVIHGIRAGKDNGRIIEILKLRTTDENLKRECVELLDQAGSFKYTRVILRQLDKEARQVLKSLGGNPVLTKLLDDLILTDDD